MKKVLFIDRDGTIVQEPPDEQVDTIGKVDFLPEVLTYLPKISRELGYELVMVTNQDGLGTDSFPETDFQPVHDLIIRTLSSVGVEWSEIFIDRTFPGEGAETRKPGTGLLQKYLYGKYDLSQSYVIGDRISDLQLAKNLRCKSIFISEEPHLLATFCSNKWKDIYQYLQGNYRRASVYRNSSETKIHADINLLGAGRGSISTNLGFLDHMLEQIVKHGSIDLDLVAKGDLHVDEHHTIEDAAIVLGSVVDKALGNRTAFNRYGFVLPMDESQATVSIDFSGRPWLVWDVAFNRPYVGDVPTEMFEHFFKSFSDHARCTLHIQALGKNDHHKIESVFKAFGRVLKMAFKADLYNLNPSTKGML